MARSDRQVVAAAFRGQLSKPASKLSDAYIARLAREVRAARAEGRKPDRQAGRGHTPRSIGGVRVTTEHPKAYVRQHGAYVAPGEARPAPIRVSPADRHVAGRGVIVQREFRSGYAAWRYLRSLGDTPAQAVAHGIPQPEYGTLAIIDEEKDTLEAIWRVFYTGSGEGEPDENGQTAEAYADWQRALYRIFVPGSVDAYIVRRQD